jgi:plastocyanin
MMSLHRSRSLTAGLLGLVLAFLSLGGAAASSGGDESGVVEIRKANELRPATMRIAAGTTVTWVNKDGSAHRVRADGGAFDSGTLLKDRTFGLRFDQGGTYAYSLGTPSGASWSWWSGGTVEVAGSSTPTVAPSSAPVTPPSGGAMVHIQDNSFSPATLSVPVGTTVTWMHMGSSKHTVTSASFDSGILSPGATFSFTFTSPGTYSYRCDLHSGMTGAIVVTGAATGTTTAPTPVPTPTTPPLAAPPSGASVSILDNSFSPASLTVPAGTTVVWTNRGGSKHTVTAAGTFDSGILSPGASFSFTFATAGTYGYVCELHGGMSGSIVVTGTATGTTPAPTPLATPTPPPPAAPPSGGAMVHIMDNSFSPATLSVPVGTTLTWMQMGSSKHTVTTGSFDSGILAAGATFRHTFTSPGTYAYRCDLHSGMTGTIVVTGGASGAVTALPTPEPGPVPTPVRASAPKGALSIVIGDNVFNPGTTRVPVGTTVSWLNHGLVRHTVTSTASVFDSGLLTPEGVFSVTFNTPGTYPYLCDLHPGMTGKIEVYASDGTVPPVSAGAAPVPAAPVAGALPSSSQVMILDNSFDAQTIRVAVGAEVSWMNHGALKHTVTFTDGSGSSPLLSTGQAWSRTFAKPGTYRYVCALHPEMTGTVVVTEAGAGATTTVPGAASAVGPAPTAAPATRVAASASDTTSSLGWQGGMLLGSVLGLMAAFAIGGPLALALRRST